MKKSYLRLILLLLIICWAITPMSIFGQSYSVSPTLQGYIDRSQGLLNQVYYLGQTAFSNVVNRMDNTELQRLVELNANLVSALERDVNGYIQSIQAGTLESRNAITLHIALHHFSMALRELINFLNTTNDQGRFLALERYFYDTVIAAENINRLNQQMLQ